MGCQENGEGGSCRVHVGWLRGIGKLETRMLCGASGMTEGLGG